ncbi:uncharacterized protein OCT59_011471 [Rhizophagus irregularis]|uniref:uncharacterized protein n=1 Tax=Rhizophagus irregularis TaxID=588596 RepID=UPI0033312793|nr:hypothetical protein OCT59_011471 [Rhizophagus irregularis]
MAIIVTFGSQVPVQKNAKFQHEYSLMAKTEMFGGSGAPGFPKWKMSPIRVSLESENVRAGYLTLVPPLQIRTWVLDMASEMVIVTS